MTYLALLLMIITFAVGAMVRDGWPSFKTLSNGVLGTQAARVTGALICSLGILPFGWLPALLVFLGILGGFYLDMKHGEAAGVDTPTAVADSFVSGFTSWGPLYVVLTLANYNSWHVVVLDYVIVASLMKPAIWWLSWKLPQGTFWYATRVAAMSYYAIMAVFVWSVFNAISN